MQINLIPKTRELEQKRNQINSIIIMVSASILIATGIIIAVIYGINSSKKNNIKKSDTTITELRSEIEEYKDVENYIGSLVKKTSDVKIIIDSSKDLNIVLRNLQALLPRELLLRELNITSTSVSFKVKATSSGKVAEAIKALEDYEAQIDVSSKDESKDKDNETDAEKTPEIKKVKMFTFVDPTNFSRYEENGSVYYGCDIIANISEELWHKN